MRTEVLDVIKSRVSILTGQAQIDMILLVSEIEVLQQRLKLAKSARNRLNHVRNLPQIGIEALDLLDKALED